MSTSSNVHPPVMMKADVEQSDMAGQSSSDPISQLPLSKHEKEKFDMLYGKLSSEFKKRRGGKTSAERISINASIAEFEKELAELEYRFREMMTKREPQANVYRELKKAVYEDNFSHIRKYLQDHSGEGFGVLNGEADLDQRWLDGGLWSMNLWGRGMIIGCWAARFTAPKYSFIQHPANGLGKRGIALGFLAVLPAREIEGVPGTLILAKAPGLTEQTGVDCWVHIPGQRNDRQATLKLVERALEIATRDHNRPIIIGGDWNAPHATLQRKVSSWGFGLHVVSFSGSKATFRGRTATARCKELALTISLCNQFTILANLPDDCDSDTVTNRLLDIINPNTAFSSLSNLPLIDTPVPVQHRRLYRATTKKAICKAKNAYRAWLASRNSILSPQETIQGKYNQYILAEATASRLTKQDDRLRWRSHCTRIDNLLAGGCAKQAWNAAKRMACASGHSCRSSNPIRNEEGCSSIPAHFHM
ncbi:hypothetical protein BASA83_003764 [Batrachochytrium salamandrivorans]|nr:hypothetical protein BASA83_003764 [Batrachochytrium salamandrivorans]